MCVTISRKAKIIYCENLDLEDITDNKKIGS